MHLKQKWLWLFICFVLIISFIQPVAVFAANPTIHIDSEVGYDNKVSFGRAVPVTFTVENKGDDFSGDIVIDTSESYQIGTARSIPITLGAGETKTIHTTLPGLTEDYMYSGSNFQMIYLYEGSWKDGKEVEFTGKKNVRPSFFQNDTIFIFTLTDSVDRLNAFKNIKLQTGFRTSIISINQQKSQPFPETIGDWDMAKVIVLDEYPISDLSDDQQQALLQWVKNGGVLITGASSLGGQSFGALQQFVPLTYSDEISAIPVENAKKFANTSDFSQPIPIQKATVKDNAATLWSANDLPIVAMNNVNKGKIIATAFSLGDEPLASEKGYDELISQVFETSKALDLQLNGMYVGQSVNERIGYEAVSTNELFSSFQVSTKIMIFIIFIYFLIVGPLLYFVLKRKDKREHAWWIIPVIAIVTSVAIFGYGARDRLLKPQIHQTSIYEAQEDGSLDGYYVETILSNRSGDYLLSAPEGTTMAAWKRNNGITGNSSYSRNQAILEEKGKTSEMTLRNVGYWSTSSVLGHSVIPSVGSLETDLTNKDGKITGTITSSYPFTLKEVAIWTGSKKLSLQDIPPKGTIDVNVAFTGGILIAPNTNNMYNNGMPVQSANELPKQRKESIIRTYGMMNQSATKPVIIGTVEEQLVPISIKGERAEMSAINIIVQPFESKTIFSGAFTLPFSSLDVSISSDQGLYADKAPDSTNQWYLQNGQFLFEVAVPESILKQNVTWKEIQLANPSSSILTLELMNQKTGEYEEVSEARTTLKENVADYVTKQGSIQMRLTKQNSTGDDLTTIPEVRFTGEVAK